MENPPDSVITPLIQRDDEGERDGVLADAPSQNIAAQTAASPERFTDSADEEMLRMGAWECVLLVGYVWTRAWVVLAGLPSDGVRTWNAADISGASWAVDPAAQG